MAQTISRRTFLKRTAPLAALPFTVVTRTDAQTSPRPNIVLIMADDLGYGDLGCYGCTDIRTPAIDQLAAQGVRFTSFYANAPECTPTRTALLTGRYPQRIPGLECAIGIGNVGRYDQAIELAQKHKLGLPSCQPTIAKLLKNAGYATGICGKWHLGYEPEFFPRNHGFDYWFGPIGGAVDYFHHCEYTGQHALYQNDHPVKRRGYLTDLITDEACKFIRRHQATPFFLYVAYTAPHTPYQGPDDETPEPVPQSRYNLGSCKTYAAMVERMDQGIDSILATLRQARLTDRTLVIFISDNGPTRIGSNGPFSGYKGNLFEGGIRVPCIVRWPGVLGRNLVYDQPCITMDLTRSIATAAGLGETTAIQWDGIDILQHVRTSTVLDNRTLFWRARRQSRTRKAIRQGNLKYLHLQDGTSVREYLFDLSSDCREENNLIQQQPHIAQRLKNRLAAWEQAIARKT